MRRNPLLYSDPSDIEETPQPAPATAKEPSGKTSFFFYFIILANSLLVVFVLGFIWFLFLKSPDLQIKEISNRIFGINTPIEQAQQPIVAPKIQTEVIISPSQQEKDEIQQAKLKQMREREDLAVERARLEEIKAEIEQEKSRAKEAQQAINDLQKQEKTAAAQDLKEKAAEIEQTNAEDLTTKASSSATASSQPSPAVTPKESATIPNAVKEPDANSTSSQVDLIMEALKNQ